MLEFKLLKNVRQHLLSQNDKLPVYFSTTDSMTYPCCVLELLESWTNMALPGEGVCSQVKMSTTYYDNELGIQQTLATAGQIASAIAGQVIALDEHHVAIFRPESQSVVMESDKQIQHTYTCIIRRS